MSIVHPNSGPAPLDKRKRKYHSHSRYYGSPSPLNLPSAGLGRKSYAHPDQEDTNICTAAGEAVSNSYEQGVDMSMEWQAAAESEYIGSPIVSGAEPTPSMEATELFGSLPARLSPYALATAGVAFICDWRNWSQTLWASAAKYLPGIPYLVDGQYSIFDNIRNALASAYTDNGAVVKVFGPWYESWNQQASDPAQRGRLRMPTNGELPISRHRWNFVDWKLDTDPTQPNGSMVLVAHMTQGETFGLSGDVFFDPQTIDTIFADEVNNSLLISRPRAKNLGGLIQMWTTILHYISIRASTLFGNNT